LQKFVWWSEKFLDFLFDEQSRVPDLGRENVIHGYHCRKKYSTSRAIFWLKFKVWICSPLIFY
jgi:hypothetical protein